MRRSFRMRILDFGMRVCERNFYPLDIGFGVNYIFRFIHYEFIS